MKRIVNFILKLLLRIICKIDASELEKIPDQGPLIVVANHVNFLDAPVVISHLDPRPTTGLAKKETWDNPLMAALFNIWGGIPIDRDIADFSAFRKAKEALDEGKILAVAPEGTRSHDGRMVRGKPGIALLAHKSDVPILPMAYYGHENFSENIKRLKRTPMHIRVGKPIRLRLPARPDKEILQTVTDAIMRRVAALLPEAYRGYYEEIALEDHDFVEPVG
jgi:1-acyl-sn-glycerol-3-phosphate acyltransferase